MRILIIGGNRFVGKKLTKRLIKESHNVTILNRSGTGPQKAFIVKFNTG